uniref:Uncharacterized protein n=1 Tax=Arundo donax TaxID=35708 RepID=A0A0A8ZA62_ARUDO
MNLFEKIPNQEQHVGLKLVSELQKCLTKFSKYVPF